MTMSLADRVAVVTGAGRGIGFGIALALCREGARVLIGELDADRGRDAAQRLTAQGHRAHALPLDVTQGASCTTLVEHVTKEYRRIDILVNNAGLFILHKSEDTPEADWRRQIDVMLTGVFLMTQAVSRGMIARRQGSIVNIASIGGMGGWPMRAAYNSAKAGVIALTEVLATEWAHYNIRVNAVSPGVVRTEMMNVAVQQGLASPEQYAQRSPMGRVAEVDEIADAVVFLVSERASYITGVNLRVDGGWVPWGNLHARGFPEEVPHG
jgi:NAD(P)-dependent dehydrogenase (short-subunit alcohol dehydrogenase family)